MIVHSMIRWLALSRDADGERAWFSPANASITEWRYGASPYRQPAGAWELVRFNDQAHLVGLI